MLAYNCFPQNFKMEWALKIDDKMNIQTWIGDVVCPFESSPEISSRKGFSMISTDLESIKWNVQSTLFQTIS
jgi:hypothetical protein